MAQSLVSIPYVGEAGGLRDWESPAYPAEIPSMAIWSWRPVAPARPEPQAHSNPGAATKISQVLAAWREAERQLQDLLEASPMRTLVRQDVTRLCAEYQRLFALANR